jgi:hypothetical protein
MVAFLVSGFWFLVSGFWFLDFTWRVKHVNLNRKPFTGNPFAKPPMLHAKTAVTLLFTQPTFQFTSTGSDNRRQR